MRHCEHREHGAERERASEQASKREGDAAPIAARQLYDLWLRSPRVVPAPVDLATVRKRVQCAEMITPEGAEGVAHAPEPLVKAREIRDNTGLGPN